MFFYFLGNFSAFCALLSGLLTNKDDDDVLLKKGISE